MDTELFDQLLASARQMQAIERGAMKARRVWAATPNDVRAVRESMNLSQENFAAALDVSVGTLRNWEQGKRNPTGPAKSLLRVFAFAPDVALRALTTPGKRPVKSNRDGREATRYVEARSARSATGSKATVVRRLKGSAPRSPARKKR